MDAMTHASFSKRVTAFAIDMGTIVFLQMVFGGATLKLYEYTCKQWSITPDYQITLLISQFCGAFFFIGYFSMSQGLWGQTIGKKMMSITVVNTKTKKPLTLKESYWRSLSYLLSSWTYGVGFILPLFRKDKLALHDLLCSTRVVLKVELSNQLELPLPANVKSIEPTEVVNDEESGGKAAS